MSTVGVVGAGTMGAGIAEVCAVGGFPTRVFDPVPDARAGVTDRIRAFLEKGVRRGKTTPERADEAVARIEVLDGLEGMAGCDLVIEAAPEELDLKHRIFGELAAIAGPETLLATNTSSLSVTAIAAPVESPERVLGLHFFNPAPVMRLVEVVSGVRTSPESAESARAVIDQMGKVAIMAADGIGFVANRCARPYTLEGLRIAEDLGLEPTEIDRVCRVVGGFPMGPFELIDLVGADINLHVARSFFEQGFGLARWRPSRLQVSQVDAGLLGRKSGQGFYRYGEGPYREPDPELDDAHPIIDRQRQLALAGPNAPAVIDRIAAQIVNEAVFALREGVASEADIDAAMLHGFNWPLGPFEWGRRLGAARVRSVLDELRKLHGEAYLAAPDLEKALS